MRTYNREREREKKNKIKTTFKFNRTKVGRHYTLSHREIPRQPSVSFHFSIERNENFSQITSPRRRQQRLETAKMSMSPRITPIDWKLRYETVQYDHKVEMDQLRLHYERELKDKVTGESDQ